VRLFSVPREHQSAHVADELLCPSCGAGNEAARKFCGGAVPWLARLDAIAPARVEVSA
jgi:hypothetical protein